MGAANVAARVTTLKMKPRREDSPALDAIDICASKQGPSLSRWGGPKGSTASALSECELARNLGNIFTLITRGIALDRRGLARAVSAGNRRFKGHVDASKIGPGLERAKILCRQLTGAAVTRM